MNSQLEIYVLYFNASDYPNKYVVRRWLGQTPDDNVLCVEDTLKDARSKIPKDKVMLQRNEIDDPVIVETWI
jgi:hypothetical protein